MNTKKQFDRQNTFNKENYDKVSLMLPKGQKAELQAIAKAKGQSLNAYINSAIQAYMNCTSEN